jgi:hypothetical protein
MKTHYVINGAIYALSEKKERKLNTLFPLFPRVAEEMRQRQKRLRWIEENGKFIDTAIVENY